MFSETYSIFSKGLKENIITIVLNEHSCIIVQRTIQRVIIYGFEFKYDFNLVFEIMIRNYKREITFVVSFNKIHFTRKKKNNLNDRNYKSYFV